MSRDPEKHLADLGEVPDAAAARVAERARARVERERGAGGVRHGARPGPRRTGRRRLALAVAACALAATAVLGANGLGTEHAPPARAAVLPLSSFDAGTRAFLQHQGMVGTAALTQEGRPDSIGHRLYVGRTGRGATCVVVVEHARRVLVAGKCAPARIGARGRAGDLFVRQLAPRRFAVEGLVGPRVRSVRITQASGGTRTLTPRDGVFGAWVEGPRSVELLDGDGRAVLRRELGKG